MKDIVLPRKGEEFKGAAGRCVVGRTFTKGAQVWVEFTEHPMLIVREWTIASFLRRWQPAEEKHPTVSPFWWVVKDGDRYLDVYGNKTRRQKLARVFSRRSIAKGWCAPGIGDRVVRVKSRSR